jgi:hypothetical protein
MNPDNTERRRDASKREMPAGEISPGGPETYFIREDYRPNPVATWEEPMDEGRF